MAAARRESKRFLAAYRQAFAARRRGDHDVAFPYGTYQLRVLGLVRVEPPPAWRVALSLERPPRPAADAHLRPEPNFGALSGLRERVIAAFRPPAPSPGLGLVSPGGTR